MAVARDAIAARDYGAALQALADGDGAGSPEWLELRGHAAYGNGDYEDAVAAWEQLHALHRGTGDRVAAARAAVMAAMFLLVDAGLLSAVRGWVRRAERALDGAADPDEGAGLRPLISAVLAYERFFSGDLDRSAVYADDAIRLGEELGVMTAVAIGRTAAARVAVLRGDVETGLTGLDEVAALLMSGELDDLTTGIMHCELVCAAQGLMRPDLAREWTDAMERWSVTGAVGGVHGRCRVHRAELLRLSGPCDAAEQEALRACEELRPWMRREYGWPLVELAMARLRRGDLPGAEETFATAAEHAWPPHPGLALLRFEQGDVEGAAAAIAAAIAHPIEAPSKELPPFGDLRLAPLFDAQAEIAAALGDAATVAEATAALERVAATYLSPALTAHAALAAARLALLGGDLTLAAAAAGSAVETFVALDAPFETARARTVLADAHSARGKTEAATAELTAARADYARYGAARRVKELDERLGRATRAPGVGGVAVRHQGTFRCEGQSWIVGLDGHEARVTNLKGLRYLHRLLAEPGREFHVLDLVAVESGTLRPSGVAAAGLPVLDDTAREAYRRRLADVEDDIAEATRENDLGRQAKAEADREYLVNELKRAIGFGARTRRTGDPAERARTAVARTLRYALDELARRHPAVAEHIRASLRTGTYCAYDPDRLAVVAWTL